MLFDLLVLLLVVFLLGVFVTIAVSLYLLFPVSDLLNAASRRLGLAGPGRDSRAAGARPVGRVDRPFVVREGESVAAGKVLVHGEIWDAVCNPDLASGLEEGDAVEVLYSDELTVRVLAKTTGTRG